MVSFGTPTDMADRSQGEIPATRPFLQKELDAATTAIRNACGWHIAPSETVTYRRVRPFAEQVWLPAMRIVSITTATVDGATVAPSSIEFDPDTGWTSLCGRRVDVEFVAGFAPVPADLVTLTLELAAGALGSPLGISREQAGAVSLSYTRTSGALTHADHARLAPYKLGWLP
ncbi:hypothetical protein [Microbacterium sp. No. 7]|uniref:hypothetical protein n=1 Tax=Microbacterium sp. No. 7 TaxID=1714373 RepID=UPI0006D000D6|nr:hypothetical protein [Microbacterium sp. No. 7]ALJ20382.1 hypothetical protein AOA12_10855 [Microbacterium sp. No. 7]